MLAKTYHFLCTVNGRVECYCKGATSIAATNVSRSLLKPRWQETTTVDWHVNETITLKAQYQGQSVAFIVTCQLPQFHLGQPNCHKGPTGLRWRAPFRRWMDAANNIHANISQALLACFKQKHTSPKKNTWTPNMIRVSQGGLSFFEGGGAPFWDAKCDPFLGGLSPGRCWQTNRTCWDQQPLRRLGLACCRRIPRLIIPNHPAIGIRTIIVFFFYIWSCFPKIWEKHYDNIFIQLY